MEDAVMYTQIAKFIAIGFMMGIGMMGPALAQGYMGAKGCESIGKYPESAGNVRSLVFMGMVFIESASVYILLIAFLILFGA